VNSRFAADLGVAFGRYGEFRIGPLYERVTLAPRIGQSGLPTLRTNESGMHASVVIDQRDSATFARSGYRIEANVHRALTSFSAGNNFSRYQWSSEYAKTFGENTIDVALKFGGLYSKAPSAYPYFELGGFLQLSGLRAGELRADQVALARVIGFRRIGNLPAFGRGIYLGGSLEAGALESPNTLTSAAKTLYGSSVFLGLDTSIGPFYIGYGHATGARRSAYLLLGRP
jgi:NTE family protein